MNKRFITWLLMLALLLPLFSTAQASSVTYKYAVQGGNLHFDASTGTITDCDTSVTRADIPSEIYGVPVEKIGYEAFAHCSKLTGVTIPSTVTSIGTGAFAYCTSLKSIEIPDTVTSAGYPKYDGAGIVGSSKSRGLFYNCTQLETAVIPGAFNYTFYGCTSLKNVTLTHPSANIGAAAFGECSALQTITIPDGTTTIGTDAFYKCTRLNTVTIGSGVTTINSRAFSECPSLKALYFRGDAPGTASSFINKFANGFTIYYLEGTKGWTTPTWNGFITKSYQLTPTQPAMVTAVPTSSTVYVNGTAVAFDAYNINNNNYFKLRDLAFVLSGSTAQFDVVWNGTANSIQLTHGRPYTPVGGEMSPRSTSNKIGVPTSSALYLDGGQINFTAYNIDNNNYFKLRDIGQALNFSVEWNGAQNSIEINTSLPYRVE